jgi:hypothetical protein
MKTKPHIIILLAVLLVAGMMISPVSAAKYTLTNMPLYAKTNVDYKGVYNMSHNAAKDGMKIALIQFTIPTESQVDFTIYYGNDSTVSGFSENHKIIDAWLVSQTVSTVNLNGVSKEYTFIDTQPFYDFNFAGYAVNRDSLDFTNTTAPGGFLIYSLNYGAGDNDLAVFYEVPNPALNTIYRVDASCSKPFDMFVTMGSPADVAGGVSKSPLDMAWEWINYAIGLGFFVFGFVTGLFTWLKFFFIDNLVMTVSLYLAITMAYSAATSKNIFRFFGKFFNDQRKLFEFIFGLWRVLIEIIASFRGIFRI